MDEEIFFCSPVCTPTLEIPENRKITTFHSKWDMGPNIDIHTSPLHVLHIGLCCIGVAKYRKELVQVSILDM